MFKNAKIYIKEKQILRRLIVKIYALLSQSNDTISKRKNLGTTNWYVYQIQHIENSKYTRDLYHLEFADCVHKSRIHTLQRTLID